MFLSHDFSLEKINFSGRNIYVVLEQTSYQDMNYWKFLCAENILNLFKQMYAFILQKKKTVRVRRDKSL